MPSNKARSTGWDPWLIIAQMISMQAIHYLTLCIVVPPLLNLFAERRSLGYEGGAASVGMVMDWREMSSRPTWDAVATTDVVVDPRRGWCIALAWVASSGMDIFYLYIFVRRPRLILDFALTLVVNHCILTTYYAGSLPLSVFFWVVMAGGAGVTTLLAEQVCVRRELRKGLRTTGEENLELLRRD